MKDTREETPKLYYLPRGLSEDHHIQDNPYVIVYKSGAEVLLWYQVNHDNTKLWEVV